MSDKPELKPCPFCEGEAYRYKFEDLQNGSYVDQYHVACGNDNCEAEIMCDTQEEADSRWNQRADLAKPSELISAQNELLVKYSEAIQLIGEKVRKVAWKSKGHHCDAGKACQAISDIINGKPALPPPPARETP